MQVVLLPIAIGGWLNRQFPKQVARASPFAPLLAMTMTVLICGSILAVNAAAVRTAGPRLLAAVAALHSGEVQSLSDDLSMPSIVTASRPDAKPT